MRLIGRHLLPQVMRSLRDTPVVLINGARQTGKTTLARSIVSRHGYRFVSFDDESTLAAAVIDPQGFLEGLGEKVAIDEVQRVPALFPAIKLAVDRHRRAGRFLLTGSADVLTMPAMSESLAGRMEPRTLWPFSQGEIEGTEERFIDEMFSARRPSIPSEASSRDDLMARALRGGFPRAYRRDEARRDDWFAAYLTTIVQRDLRDLTDVRHLDAMPRILSLIATRAGGLLNVSDLSRSAGIPLTTLQRYLTLLQHAFLVRSIPPWSRTPSKRLVKSPKIVLLDPGLLAHLSGLSRARLRRDPTLAGPLMEAFAATELMKQASWSRIRTRILHFRTHGGREVDLVLEAADGRVVGIEVKASASLGRANFAGMGALREMAGAHFHRGVVLYAGTETLPFGDRMWAMPLSSMWSPRPIPKR